MAYESNKLIDLKRDALVNRNVPLLFKIRSYENHVAILQKVFPALVSEGFEIDADKVQFDPMDNESFLRYHALAQSGGIKPEQLQALVAACPPVTFVSASMLSDDQIERYVKEQILE